jgi:hypothetical protein
MGKIRRKEIYVPSDQAAKRLQPEALDAFLDGILAELAEPGDPAALDEIRAAFRRRVPFSKRSYAAAALILRAAGLSKGATRGAGKETLAAPPPSPRKDQKAKKPEGKEQGARKAQVPREPKRESRRESERETKREAKRDEEERQALPPRPRFTGEGTTLFLSMGKRQRFYPRILIDLLVEAGIQPESIGDVRAFDNYCFADIDPARADAAIAALDGREFRGRKLSAGPAKKRDEQQGEAE